jgi:pyrroline-5-carboxylate reductase
VRMKSMGIIGLGRMGHCMVRRLIDSGEIDKKNIFFTTKHVETATKAESELGIRSCENNLALVAQSDVVVIAVKPQSLGEVLGDLAGKIGEGKTVVSIVASITTTQIEKALGKNVAVIRAMPNTPAFVGEAMTALCLGKEAGDRDWERASMLFRPLGKLVRVDERHMNAVTGLSGCGPAYVYVILESLTDAGIKVGLPRELASQLASQTVLGAAKMLQETGRHPAALKDEVTTPAGCTIDGLMELEEGKLRVTLIKAVVQATKRAQRLVKTSKI